MGDVYSFRKHLRVAATLTYKNKSNRVCNNFIVRKYKCLNPKFEINNASCIRCTPPYASTYINMYFSRLYSLQKHFGPNAFLR